VTAGPAAGLAARFAGRFGRAPQVAWWAPGRVNLIGEHTDYNDGFVLPLAIPYGVAAAVAARPDGVLRVASAQVPGAPVEVAVEALAPGAVSGWAAYIVGVVWALRAEGHPVGGADVLVDGDVPLGAGLSSSAALGCAVAAALADGGGLALPRPELARLAQRSENAFVGAPTGIMDQSAALLATAGHALFLDTRTLAAEQVPLDLPGHHLALLVVDTRAPHALVDGAYADRRRTCAAAARTLGVPALRDVPAGGLDAALAALADPVARRRVRHVVTENDRVLRTVDLLRRGDLRAVGPLLTASHESLRDDYEVSVPRLDVAVAAALAAGALGARVTGGGFGGCVVVLVAAAAVPSLAAAVADAFAAHGWDRPRPFTVLPTAGAHPLDVSG
jgi:galactokinase